MEGKNSIFFFFEELRTQYQVIYVGFDEHVPNCLVLLGDHRAVDWAGNYI